MTNVPLQQLYESPFGGHQHSVFENLKVPLQLAASLVHNPDLVKFSEVELNAYWTHLRPAWNRLEQTVHDLYGKAPQTVDAGYAIRKAVWHIWATLADLFEGKLPENPRCKESELNHSRQKLEELAKALVPKPLMVELHKAIFVESSVLAKGAKIPPKRKPRKQTRKPAVRSALTALQISLAEAQKLSGINRGIISRAVNAGEIKNNGERGKGKRKIDSADFNRWVLERDKKAERTETEEGIKMRLGNQPSGMK